MENSEEITREVGKSEGPGALSPSEEIPLRERKSIKLLGQPDRAEKLVRWSKERVKTGTRHKEEFPNGLTLVFVAALSEPKVYIHWNPGKFKKYLESLKKPERLFQVNWGVAAEYHPARFKLRLLTVGRKERVVLWDTANSFCAEHNEDDVSWLCGMIRFRENGPVFLPLPACQQELEEAAALAVIDGKGEAPAPRNIKAKLEAPRQAEQSLKEFFSNPAVASLVSALRKRERQVRGG